MLVLGLELADLAATRFAISPMAEVVGSLQRRHAPGRHAASGPWEAEIGERLAGMDTELLDALVAPHRWLPDFLSPFPERPRPTFEQELDVVRATDPRRVRADIEAAYDGVPLPPVLERGLRRPGRLITRIADTVATYWDRALADRWPRMAAVLEADVAYRSHRLVSDGLEALFADLHPRVRWDDGRLYVDVSIDREVEVAGRRLPLTPGIFARRPLVNISSELPPALVYPARGAATAFDDTPPAPGQLAALLGRGRADVLAALAVPRATVDLARALGVTPSAVSQHLRVLAGCGLVAGARQGRRVVYRRTQLGDRLAGAVTAPAPAPAPGAAADGRRRGSGPAHRGGTR